MKLSSLTLQELLTISFLSVAIGVVFWGWTYAYYLFKPFLKALGVGYLSAGLWIFSCLFLSFIIRKPFVAILSSCIAALVEGMASSWGPGVVLYGLIQGIGAECLFLCFGYKKWNLGVLTLAGTSSCVLSYFYDFFLKNFQTLGITANLLQLFSFVISAFFLATLPTYFIGYKLKSTGLLNNFLIGKES